MTTASGWIAIVLAAGKGTRMKSALPKVLHPLLGRPMLAWVLAAAKQAGLGATVAVVGYGRERIVEAMASEFSDVRYALQEEQRGTGHAALCSRDALAGHEGPVLILYGDTPLLRSETLAEFLCAHVESGARASVLSFVAENPHGYGRLNRGPAGELLQIVEEKDATAEQRAIREVNAGIYALQANDLFAALDGIRSNNAQGEYYLPDIVPVLVRDGHQVRVHLASDASDFRGINNRAELAELEAVLRQRRNRDLMLEGVSMQAPESTYVDWAVEIGRDTVLAPGVRLEGRTSIGEGCSIGAGSVLVDSVVGAGTVVRPYCVMDRAHVGENASIGPFAHLRPAADIGAESRVGNFVEVKNVKMGKRSKALHLTYLGDAEIGNGVNVGAGTITCNYDGQVKHHTTIRDDCFIGSDSVLVAPIEIGSGAYVAAGSVVTRNVPERALAIGRARQENKEGYRDILDRRRGLRRKGAADEPAVPAKVEGKAPEDGGSA